RKNIFTSLPTDYWPTTTFTSRFCARILRGATFLPWERWCGAFSRVCSIETHLSRVLPELEDRDHQDEIKPHCTADRPPPGLRVFSKSAQRRRRRRPCRSRGRRLVQVLGARISRTRLLAWELGRVADEPVQPWH